MGCPQFAQSPSRVAGGLSYAAVEFRAGGLRDGATYGRGFNSTPRQFRKQIRETKKSGPNKGCFSIELCSLKAF